MERGRWHKGKGDLVRGRKATAGTVGNKVGKGSGTGDEVEDCNFLKRRIHSAMATGKK